MKEWVLATGNAGKLAELSALLAQLGIAVRAQAEFAVPEVAETGLSFVENAILKARHAARHTGLPALADDSGLEVDALHGAPGIYSARYATPDTVLQKLTGVPLERRRARFQCVLAWLHHATDPMPLLCQGTWEGVIATAPRGSNGFGYDPIFYLPELGKTVAELDSTTKNRLSHRAQALAQLKQALLRQL